MSMTSANYEYVLVLDAEQTDEAIAETVEKFRALIAEHGEIAGIDEWGKRRLAYKINFKSEGYYVIYTFATDKPEFIAELERVSKINETILRWLVVKKEA